ncbi:MAG: hypothetical protein WC058_09560 [Phycisphaeraceae bacterium]
MRSVILCIVLAMCAGCHFPGEADPITPAGWLGQTVPAASPDYDINIGAPRIQMIVCYGGNYFQHGALRVITTDRPALLWDPSGTFTERYNVTRSRDIVRGDSTLDRFWVYRLRECGGRYMQVFEFDTTDADADRLYDALLAGGENRPDSFDTTGGAFDCARLIARFLRQYPTERFTVPEIYFFPHNLGLHLWTQHPTRVYLYQRGEQPKILMPSGEPHEE